MSSKEITYTLGKLSKKIGVSRDYLLKHLRETGLISECFRDRNRYLRIPYSVVIRISGPEALSEQKKHLPRNTSPPNPQSRSFPQKPKPTRSESQLSRGLADWLARSGISLSDLIALQQKGEKDE